MKITEDQKKILTEYEVTIHEDVNDTLLDLDDKILQIGFNKDYSLNAIGLKLQRLYDVLYNQNE